jgi:hypothetical protein
VKAAPLTIIVLSVAAGLWWGAERSAAAQLRLQLESLQQQTDAVARLRQEHDRLLRLQPSAGELEHLRREATARDQPVPRTPESSTDASPTLPHALQPGRWAPAADWKNCGRLTPESALETMLWASAGGDLAALKETLQFDKTSRAKIVALLASLPDSARQQYASPEDLLALVVAGNVPLESAQLVARQQTGDDNVIEYVRLKNPAGVTRQVHLTLRRSSDGWKLQVPAATVDDLAQSLPKAPAP